VDSGGFFVVEKPLYGSRNVFRQCALDFGVWTKLEDQTDSFGRQSPGRLRSLSVAFSAHPRCCSGMRHRQSRLGPIRGGLHLRALWNADNARTGDAHLRTGARLPHADYSRRAMRHFADPSGLSAGGDHVLLPESVYAPTGCLRRGYCRGSAWKRASTLRRRAPGFNPCFARIRACVVREPGSITMEVQDVPAIAEAAHLAERWW